MPTDQTHRHAPPALEAYDGGGRLTNRIRVNPAWREVSRRVYEHGIVGLNHGGERAPFAITFAMGHRPVSAEAMAG